VEETAQEFTVPPADAFRAKVAALTAASKATTRADSYQAVADVNPDVQYKIRDNDAQWMRRKVIRGGSWRDVAFYLQVSTRDYEFADTSKAYIGFRCIYQEIAQSLTNRRAMR